MLHSINLFKSTKQHMKRFSLKLPHFSSEAIKRFEQHCGQGGKTSFAIRFAKLACRLSETVSNINRFIWLEIVERENRVTVAAILNLHCSLHSTYFARTMTKCVPYLSLTDLIDRISSIHSSAENRDASSMATASCLPDFSILTYFSQRCFQAVFRIWVRDHQWPCAELSRQQDHYFMIYTHIMSAASRNFLLSLPTWCRSANQSLSPRTIKRNHCEIMPQFLCFLLCFSLGASLNCPLQAP